MNRPTSNRRPLARSRGGFTMIELLMVMIIIAILIALLLPAITGALKSARKSAVSAEINQLAQALADFKSKYGDYPPSRFLAVENGNYSGLFGSTLLLSSPNGSNPYDPSSPGDGDITLGQLAQRSAAAIHKFWPRVTTNVALTNKWYDFNGNGLNDQLPYVLHGHECLAFFLGGIPSPSQPGSADSTFGMSGFGKDPTNPFSNNITSSLMYSANRQPPIFEFNAGRLFLDPNGLSGIPGYYDSLSATPPANGSGSTLNFYAYFSAYGNGGYDPNDVNFTEVDGNGNGPIGLSFSTTFPVITTKAVTICDSYAPNPYTSTLSIGSPVTFQNAQTFQIISSGLDGLYGVGGQYVSNASTSALPLPFDSANTFYGQTSGTTVTADTDNLIRNRESDNLTNFKAGSLN
jgi:prepilin-type N-terminal cleavage/methylation domain-containing protein